jgi:periplasmic protein TonB
MTAIAAERSHLMRWVASAAVVVGLHGLGVAALLAWHDPVGVGDESPAVVIDLAPYVAPSESTEDLPPGPLQQQAAAPAPEQKVERRDEPKPEDEKLEAKIEPVPQEKIEVPPAPVPPVAALAPPEAVEPPVTAPELAEPAPPTDTPPAPVTTAPPRQRHASVAEINKWHTGIVAQIESHLVYPTTAQARRQMGVVKVEFSFNRQGRVISSQVVDASAYAALNQAALETLQKAQPFPPPPAGTPDDTFTFTIPVRFRLR